jgi:CHAD domain-containing protein
MMDTLGDYAHHALEQHLGKVHKQAHKLKTGSVHDPEHPEAIHQLRVGLRRLQTAFTVFSPCLQLPKVTSAKTVQKITARFGLVRDLDVLQDHLTTQVLPSLPLLEQMILRQYLLSDLQAERRLAWRQAEQQLNASKFKHLQEGLQTWLRQPQYRPLANVPIATVAPDLLSPLLSQLLLHPGWLITEPPTDDSHQHPAAKTLHDLRKQVKRLRYPAEQLQGVFSKDLKHQVKTWAHLQDILGHLHDQSVLIGWLGSSFKADIEQTLPTFAHLLQTQAAQTWQEWQPIQAQYLDPDYRRHLRSLLQQVG